MFLCEMMKIDRFKRRDYGALSHLAVPLTWYIFWKMR